METVKIKNIEHEEKRGKDGTIWRLSEHRIGYSRGDTVWFTGAILVAASFIKNDRGELCICERHGITLSQWAEI